MINNYLFEHNNIMIVKKNLNLYIIILLLILNIISLFNMYNTRYIDPLYSNYFLKQLIWFIISYLIIFLFKHFKLNNILKYSKLLYLISLFLLILVLLTGKVINGSRCWLTIFHFTFQPSELMKLSLALSITNITLNNKRNTIKDEFYLILKLIIITLIPSILVFLEPDTGAIISFLIILLVTLISLKLNKIYYLGALFLFFIFIFLFSYFYFFNKDLLIKLIGTSFFYRMDRIINFTNGNSYQLERSLINIGSAPLFFKGFNKVKLIIPESPTDFFFAFSTNTLGLIPSFFIIIIFFILDILLLKKISKLKKNKYYLFTYSYFYLLLFHQIYNIGMNLGLFPIMGIPLPFLSYGGSSTLINYIFLGIILGF